MLLGVDDFAHKVKVPDVRKKASRQVDHSRRWGKLGRRLKGFNKGCLLYVQIRWKRLL